MPKPRLADLVRRLDAARRRLDRAAAARGAAEEVARGLEAKILSSFTKAELAAVRVGVVQVTRVEEELPQIIDIEKVYAWIKRNNRFELLHRRISREVWREQLDAGKPVPGLGAFTRVTLRLTRGKVR
jgi:hypothetical protein